MRLVVLTSMRRGLASLCLPALCGSSSLQVTAVILARGQSPDRKGLCWRRVRKTARIGLLGAINGVRIRRWFQDSDSDDIGAVSARCGVPLLQSEYTNCERTRQLFRDARADLGVSLGNSFIGRSVFSIPRFGMINIHMEILPRFQGAQSIIWPIHESVKETGYTIHQIDDHIDTGEILDQKVLPIDFCARLEDTVRLNRRRVRDLLPDALVRVCENYEAMRACARPQVRGRGLTTPSVGQFMRMVRNNRRFYLQQRVHENHSSVD
jgi:methionyl-tRNA formyltransferase